MEVKAEESSGLRVEICFAPLPETVWGLHVARGDRVRLCINSALPDIWKRFAAYHELYHLIAHSMGESFWKQTFNPISKFETEADMFAWAAIWPEWSGEE
jgi:Zn-dependent peptidase ImmA (M78 family)